MQHDKKPRYGGVFYYTKLQIRFSIYSIRILLKLPASLSHVEVCEYMAALIIIVDYKICLAPMLESEK